MMSWTTLALLMLPLVGHLQAAPLDTPPRGALNMEAMGFRLLVELSCEKGVNFTSPTNLEVNCYDAVLGHFIREFQQADGMCSDEEGYIKMALEELEDEQAKTQTECSLTMKTHAAFAGFVNATEEFVQRYNDYKLQRK